MRGLELLRSPGAPPLLVGHRGACDCAPENTLVSFQRAVDDGADIVELDVRLTADGYVVALHDETVDRTTDGAGRIAELTLAEAQRLDAGAWFAPQFAGARIPALTEVFDWARGKVGLLIELKYGFNGNFDPHLAPTVAALICEHDIADQVAFISYWGRGFDQLHALLPGMRAGPLSSQKRVMHWAVWLTHRFPRLAQVKPMRRLLLSPLNFAREVEGTMVSPNIEVVTPALVAASHAAGMPISSGGFDWDYPAAIALGVDTISSNDPGRVRRRYLTENTLGNSRGTN